MTVLNKPCVLYLLMLFIESALTSPKAATHTSVDKRSTSQLEYVMRVLEEQGRLGEVDEQLLKRIQSTINENENQGEQRRKSKQNPLLNEVLSSPRESVLSLARTRQEQLFRKRHQNRFTTPEPRRKLTLGGDCQALKTENILLKQQLLSFQTQLQQQHKQTNRALGLFGNNQESKNFSQTLKKQKTMPSHLDKLLLRANNVREEESEDPHSISLSSILITSTPTVSTIFDTTRSV